MSGRPNVDVRHRETLGATNAYKQYRFCARAENDHGASDWVTIGTDAVETIPGKPSKPTYASLDSEFDTHASGSHILTKVAWSVKEKPQTPVEAGDPANYLARVFRSSKSSATTEVCEETSSTTDYTLLGTPAIDDTLGGTRVTIEAGANTDLLGDEPIGTYYLHACVRATPMPARLPAKAGGSDADDMGPWEVGRSNPFKRALGAPRLSAANQTGGTETKLTWTAVNGAASYTVHSDIERNGGVDVRGRRRPSECLYRPRNKHRGPNLHD